MLITQDVSGCVDFSGNFSPFLNSFGSVAERRGDASGPDETVSRRAAATVGKLPSGECWMSANPKFQQ